MSLPRHAASRPQPIYAEGPGVFPENPGDGDGFSEDYLRAIGNPGHDDGGSTISLTETDQPSANLRKAAPSRRGFFGLLAALPFAKGLNPSEALPPPDDLAAIVGHVRSMLPLLGRTEILHRLYLAGPYNDRFWGKGTHRCVPPDPAHEAIRAAARRFIASRARFHAAEERMEALPPDAEIRDAFWDSTWEPAASAYEADGKALNGLLASADLSAVLVDGQLLVGVVAVNDEPMCDPPVSCNPRARLLDLDAIGGRS